MVLLIELIYIEVPVSFEIAVDLLDVLVFDDVLFKTQSKDCLGEFELATNGLSSIIAEEIVHQIDFL